MIPPLYIPLATPEEMSLWDNSAMHDYGLPFTMLMENAAREAASTLHTLVSISTKSIVTIIMGGGNNGGDGAALGRNLHDAGINVLVCHTVAKNHLQGAAAEHTAIAMRCGVPFFLLKTPHLDALPHPFDKPNIVIDALTGTGFHGNLREKEQTIVQAINSFKNTAFIYSLDIPSGLHAMLGIPMPVAVKAHATITFEAAKPGLFQPKASEFTGQVFTRPIGIPSKVKNTIPSSYRLLHPVPGSWASPTANLHKGTAGKVLIIGGSETMTGAPLLAGLGALHTGAGIVHIACPKGIKNVLQCHQPELIVHGVGNNSLWERSALSELINLIEEIQPHTIVMGLGMGRSKDTACLVRGILTHKNRSPVILDADGLFFVNTTTKAEVPANILRSDDIVTPHPGELARMIPPAFFNHPNNKNNKIFAIQKNRINALKAFIDVFQCTLVLKGAGTLIGKMGQSTVVSPWDIPALAIPGSGDVLSGIIGALGGLRNTMTDDHSALLPSFDTACLGVYLHAKAGLFLNKTAPKGHLASDLAKAVPHAWQKLIHGNTE